MAEAAEVIETPEVKPQKKKVVGFATRSDNKERIDSAWIPLNYIALEEHKKQDWYKKAIIETERLQNIYNQGGASSNDNPLNLDFD